MTVTVLTPSIGTPALEQAVRSVQLQTVPVRHIVVADGSQYLADVTKYAMRGWQMGNHPLPVITSVPDNTGQPDWYGHRIYANYAQLLDTDYLFLLDEDNEYLPNHVESMLERAEMFGFAWSYRNIRCGDFYGKDIRESIGVAGQHPSVNYRLVDTSSWAFSREKLRRLKHIEHRWGADRRLTEAMVSLEDAFHSACTGQHTLIYNAPVKNLPFYTSICSPCPP
jgi:glycosyltransferase involved in cell wall biosynthesis